jgi:hypothetical protein
LVADPAVDAVEDADDEDALVGLVLVGADDDAAAVVADEAGVLVTAAALEA